MAGIPASPSRRMARVRCCRLRFFAPASTEQSYQSFARCRVVGIELDPGADQRQHPVGRQVPRRQLGNDCPLPDAHILIDRDPPCVEILATRQIEVFEEFAGRLSQQFSSSSEVSSPRPRFTASRRSTTSIARVSAAIQAASRSATMRSPRTPRNLLRLQRSAPLGSSGTSQNKWHNRSRRSGLPLTAR